jgi:hypothetical protein
MIGRQTIKTLLSGLLLAGAMQQPCLATDYRTDRLAAIAQKLGMANGIDSIAEPVFKTCTLAVDTEGGRVVHIGVRLFSEAQREAFGITMCRFVERYLLELALPLYPDRTCEEQLGIDGIFVTPLVIEHHLSAATLQKMVRLCADSTVSIHVNTTEGRGYTMSFLQQKKSLCRISFPIDYNLLMGVDMDERERRLPQELAQYNKPDAVNDNMFPTPDPQQLRKAWNDNYYTLDGGHYLIGALSGNSYYEKDDSGQLRPIFSPLLPVESLANLLITGIVDGDYTMDVRLRKYGFKTEVLQTTPARWLAFCLAEGCKPYFGLIALDSDKAECELLMHCPDKGFNHVMRLKVPLRVISEHKGAIEARLNAYVSASKIKNLFEEFKQ